MPGILGMLICNPLLERTLLENKEAKGDHTDINLLEENKEIKDSLHQLIVTLHQAKTETNIEITFNNFRLLMNEKTIEKIFEFVFKIGHSLDSQDNQLQKIKDELVRYQKELNPEATEKDIIQNIEFADLKNEQNLFATLSKIRTNYLVKEKKVKVIKLERLEEKQRVNVSGTINNVEI